VLGAQAQGDLLLAVARIETRQEKEVKLGTLMVDILCVNKLCSESEFASVWIVFLPT